MWLPFPFSFPSFSGKRYRILLNGGPCNPVTGSDENRNCLYALRKDLAGAVLTPVTTPPGATTTAATATTTAATTTATATGATI